MTPNGHRESLGTKVTRRLRLYGARFRREIARREPPREAVAARFGAPRVPPGGLREVLSRALAAMPDGVAEPPPPRERVEAARRGHVVDHEQTLDLTRGVDWHLDPVFRVRWPRRFVGAISDLRAGSDVTLLWHRNQMMFLLDLAAAWAAGPDEGLARLCYASMDSWCRQNPFMVGMNWRSPMEAGTRLVSWSLALARLRSVAPPDERRCARLLRAILHQADFVAGGFSRKPVPNNHLVGEAATLFAFATYWPGMADAGGWRARAERVLEEEARRQVLDDGFQYENALNYHLYVLDFYLVYLHAKALRGEPANAAVRDAVAGMADATLRLLSPAGRYPRIGDDSVTRFFALRAPREVSAPGARARFADLVKPAWAEVLRGDAWGAALLERACARAWRGLFPAAGIAVLRDARAHLVLTAGPQHQRPFSDGHLHADAGSFELEIAGRPVVIDSGTWLYNYDAAARRHFRGARAHNTVLVDDVEPMEPAETFAWKTIHRADAVALDAEHARVGCTRTVPGGGGSRFRHHRIVAACGDAWVVADGLAPVGATGAHRLSAYLHTPFAAARCSGAGEVDLGEASGGLSIRAFASRPIDVALVGAPDALASYSRWYGDREFGTTVRTSADIGDGGWLVHVIAPAAARVTCSADGGVVCVRADDAEIALDIDAAPPERRA